MKIRENLNKELFTEDNVEELLDTLDRLHRIFEDFIYDDKDGGQIVGIFLKPNATKLINNKIFASLIYDEKE